MLRCTRCCKAGPDTAAIRSQCVDASIGIMPCPEPILVTPGRDIVLKCRKEDCGRSYSFPANRVTQKLVPNDVSCPFTHCEISSVVPQYPATVEPGLMARAKDMVRGKQKKD